MTNKEAVLERIYAQLSPEEQKIVDRWTECDAADRSAFWSTLSRKARQYLYMHLDGHVGLFGD